MSLTPEQLMLPRYVCTGTPGKPLWHRSIFKHGDIVAMDDKGWYEVKNEHSGTHLFKNEYFIEFPHLFRPMPWWKARKPEEMPEYVKGPWGKVSKLTDDMIEAGGIVLEDYMPATESEYMVQNRLYKCTDCGGYYPYDDRCPECNS